MKVKSNNSFSFTIAMSLIYCAFFCSEGVAQESNILTSKGNIEIGGNVSYQYLSDIIQGSEYTHTNFIIIEPYIGYFINDNFEIGFNPFVFERIWSEKLFNYYNNLTVCSCL